MQFEPITIDRQADYNDLLRLCPQKTSDYSFVNLWGWADVYGLSWAWSDQVVWIRQARPAEQYWAPVGPWFAIDWKREFKECSDRPQAFHRVPEQLVQVWQERMGPMAHVAEERDHWDYLYDRHELTELKGNRFHKKKNLLNQFRKKYPYQYVPFRGELVDKALAMQENWCTWRDCESSKSLAAENRVIEKVLQDWDSLAGMLGGAILVEDDLIAYTIAEKLSPDTLVIHFEKGSSGYQGIYQAINQMFLESMGPETQWVNREQDLGDEGLRNAKLSYHPVGFLKKYKVLL